MPKKTPRNAFYFFMLDYKARCERAGEKFQLGLRDVQGPAGDEWKVLPPEMKKPYEDRAKAEKLQAKGDNSGKVTSLHNSFAFIDKKSMREEKARQEMDAWMEATLCSLSHDKKTMANYKWYLIHANYLIVSERDHYYAVEVGVVEFSLADGVTNTYHTLIDPGPLPLGSLHSALDESRRHHQIPPDHSVGEKEKSKILASIKKIMEPAKRLEGQYPPLFTMGDNTATNTSMSCVKNLLEVLCENAEENPKQFRVFPLDRLFHQLKNAASVLDTGDEAFPFGVARNELERDVHSYVYHIACEFHQEIDVVQWCSLSYVQRWAYMICDHTCEYLDVKLEPGKHCPQNTSTTFLPERVKKTQKEKKPEQPASFTWIDHSQSKWQAWVPPALPRPTRQTKPVALSHNYAADLEDNFPAMSLAMGRGRGCRQPPNPGTGGPCNYAAATKK